ncbi:MAG: SprT family zinc-dependent metalloprotease [Pseudomonadota bacterium]
MILSNLGPDVCVIVRPSSRAIKSFIKVNKAGVTLVVPHKDLRVKDIAARYNKFLLEKEAWIRKHLDRLASSVTPIWDNKTMPFFGKIHSLEYIEEAIQKVELGGGVIRVYGKALNFHNILINFAKQELLAKIIMLITPLKEKHNLNFSTIKIMNNKTKWGSCSSKAVLAFNWRLIFAPVEILQYIIAHELCHIAEMNHGPNFWSLVEKMHPDYKSAKTWLKKNGYSMYQYLAN